MQKKEKYYLDRIKDLDLEIEKLSSIISKIGWLRLIVLLLGGVTAWKLYENVSVYAGILVITFTIILFIVVVNIHGKKIKQKDDFEIARDFNNKGICRLNDKYREFEDTGKDFLEEGHPFSSDLDVFGNNSLFQMINTTRTKSGRQKLSDILSLKDMPSKNEIKEKQEAIKELGEKVDWRERFFVGGTFKKKKKSNEELEALIRWCKSSETANYFPRIIIAGLFMIITATLIILTAMGVINVSVVVLDLIINFAVVKVLAKDKDDAINLFHNVKYNVKAYYNILAIIQDESFKSKYLSKLKNKLEDDSKISCKQEMKKLSSLLDWIGDSSANAYFFILNIFVFADVFILYNISKWKKVNGEKIEKWLSVMGEFDALSSISNLSFDHENWAFAQIVDEKQIEGEEIAHPLIGEKAVSNNYKLSNSKQVTLITGSNMSGKSTFLRSVGINLVLAYIGAPCCAKSFKCGILNIYTCMRTKDNLEESISSFYAEILRIKLIIEACKEGKDVIFLLDEIFKGTNSRDRHTGATVLVKQLINNGAIGLLSTHDLELCDLEYEMKQVENYNFREYYEDNKIKFDYKLRNGRSTTQNAVYLMRLAGIEIEK